MLYNIDPNVWGPHFWRAMHYLTVAYPDDPTDVDKENVKQFFTNIGNILPCEKCRSHYAKNLEKYPLSNAMLASRHSLINWLKDIHNEVSSWTGKKQWSYQDIIHEYGSDKKEEKNYYVEIATICLLLLALVIIVVYIRVRK